MNYVGDGKNWYRSLVRMTIGLNFETELFVNTSVFWAYTRVLHKTLENISNEYMGFQSVLYNPTVVYMQIILIPPWPFL